MRKLSLLLLLLLPGFGLMAAPVSREKAQQLASEFLAKNLPQSSRRSIKAVASTMALKPASTESYYHVFNIGSEQGFVVVSGDDRTQAIIGYTDKGSFDETQLPDNVKGWLAEYVSQMQWLEAHPTFENSTALNRAPSRAPVKSAVAPLIATLWDQYEPFYNECPDFFTYGKSLTGCVATAMAQLMYYHRWPAQLQKTIEGYDCERLWSGYGKISVPTIAAGLTFDWDNMLLEYGHGTDAQDLAVAQLMATCGAAVHMDYANNGSSAYDNAVVPALLEYFDYSAMTRQVAREDYNYEAWTDLIYNELAEDRPVYYGGMSSGGGHAFLVDGYDGEGYFHVNWGWGGHYNGFYLLSVLKPDGNDGAGASKSSDGYSFRQMAVVGVKKNEGEAPVKPEIEAPMEMELISASIEDGTAYVSGGFFSSYPETATIDFGFAYVAANGSLVTIQERQFADLPTGYGNNVSLPVTGLSDGSYRIVPVSRLAGTQTWYTCKDSDVKYVRCVVQGGSVKEIELVIEKPQLVASDFVFPKKIYSNIPVNVEVKIKNNSAREYYGMLYLFASVTDQKGAPVALGGVTVLANQQIETSFEFIPGASGNFNLWVATDEGGNNVVGTAMMTVGEAVQKTDDIELEYKPVFSPLSADGQNIVGTQATVTWTVTNPSDKAYEGNIFFVLYTWNNDGTAKGESLGQSYTILPGESVTYKQTYDVTRGTYYSADIIYIRKGMQENPNKYVYVRYGVVSGLSYYLADGTNVAVDANATFAVPAEATAVDLRDNTLTTQLSGGNPNTIYFLSEGATAPAGCGANIVVDGVAENIVVEDGYDFVTPELFTAKNIVYERTFTQGLTNDNKGWSTIALPFDVSEIAVDNAGVESKIEWFKAEDEKDKDFWLMQFDHDDADNLFFAEAEDMKAVTPYLIAVPGAGSDKGTDLTGKTIRFKAENVLIHPEYNSVSNGQNFRMKGLNAAATISGAYALDADGAQFVKGEAALKAFRAYFLPAEATSTFSALNVKMKEEEPDYDGISTIEEQRQLNDCYTVDGRKIGAPARPGFYIVGKRKVVRVN